MCIVAWARSAWSPMAASATWTTTPTASRLLAGQVGPSHAYVRIEAFGRPVNVAEMIVCPGDLIHADQHGAVVIPQDVAADLPVIVDRIVRKEAVIIEASKRPGFDFDTLARAMSDSEDIH